MQKKIKEKRILRINLLGPMSENDLMLLISKGDEQSFEHLFSDLYPSLLSVASHMTADEIAARDIVQEVFARLWVNRSTCAMIKNPKDFLFIATRNRTISYLRSKRTLYRHRDSLEYEERFRAGLVEEEVCTILSDAITRLPRRSAEVIRLSMEGLPQENIAETMGIAVPTVKSLKADGIRKLRQMLGSLSVLLF